jgi:hypothetical protein
VAVDHHSIFNAEWFALLELPYAFDVDAGALEKGYLRAQQIVHPDRWRGIPQELPSGMSAHINKIYLHLKDPKLRAEYMLRHQSAWPVPTPALVLEEIFTLKSQSLEAQTAVYQNACADFDHAIKDKDIPKAQHAYLYLCYLKI